MAAEGAGGSPDPLARFEAQASASGLAVPAKHPVRLWLALVVVAVVIGASIGVGELTGWAIGPRVPNAPAVYGQDACAQAPSYLSIDLEAAVSGEADPALAADFLTWGLEFANWTGDCVHLHEAAGAGDGYLPLLASKSVEFAAAQAAPNATEASDLSAPVSLFPVAVVPIAVAYDLPGLASPLHLNGSVLAAIYLGSVTSWDAPSIAALNPGADLADLPAITVMYRSDTAVLNTAYTTYLARASTAWNSSIGIGSSVAWPVGVAEGGASAMAAALGSTPGSIGYVEAAGPTPANSSYADLQNPAGAFAAPGPKGAAQAAAGSQNSSTARHDEWTQLPLIDAPGSAAYPISQFVYVAVYHDLGTAYAGHVSATNATWLLSFFWWLSSESGTQVSTLGFGALPSNLALLDRQSLENVTYDGGSLLETNEGGSEGGTTDEF